MSLRSPHGGVDDNSPSVDGHVRQIESKPFDVGTSAQGLENLYTDVRLLTPVLHHPYPFPGCVVGHPQQLRARNDVDAFIDQCGFQRTTYILVHP